MTAEAQTTQEQDQGESGKRQIIDYVNTNFVHFTVPDYPDRIAILLDQHPHRAANPSYVGYFRRMIRMAAEYGFPSAKAHLDTKATRDCMDPLTLLALGGYLAEIGLKAAEQKGEAEEFWNRKKRGNLSEKDKAKIQATWIRPSHGEVNLPVPKDFFRARELYTFDHWQGTRLDHKLPLYPADVAFNRELLSVAPNMQEVDQITQEDFVQNRLPKIVPIFLRQGINVTSVFMDPGEWQTTV